MLKNTPTINFYYWSFWDIWTYIYYHIGIDTCQSPLYPPSSISYGIIWLSSDVHLQSGHVFTIHMDTYRDDTCPVITPYMSLWHVSSHCNRSSPVIQKVENWLKSSSRVWFDTCSSFTLMFSTLSPLCCQDVYWSSGSSLR